MSEKDTYFGYKKVKREHFRVIAPRKAAGPLDEFLKPAKPTRSLLLKEYPS